MRHLPLPGPPPDVVAAPACRVRPLAPYQIIVAELRASIHAGVLPAGTTLPTVEQLGARHHVAPCTAHRAIAVLAKEQLVTVSRGRRAVVNSLGGGNRGD